MFPHSLRPHAPLPTLAVAPTSLQVPLNDITPPMRDVEIELNVVGVRELLSYNNVPIGAPFVEIDAGDRSSPDKVRSTRPSQTPSGPDANFLETLVIHTRIPEELLFCPSLNVRVFDYRTSMRLRKLPPPWRRHF